MMAPVLPFLPAGVSDLARLLRDAPAWAMPAAVGGLVAIGVILGLLYSRFRRRRRVARTRRLGRVGEERALELLRAAGYRVIDTEVTGIGRIEVDGEAREFTVRADAIVKRWFRTYVAEFKGGPAAASPDNRATRRQLMEYERVFDTSGVLLVDAGAGTIRRVSFP